MYTDVSRLRSDDCVFSFPEQARSELGLSSIGQPIESFVGIPVSDSGSRFDDDPRANRKGRSRDRPGVIRTLGLDDRI